MKPLKGSNRLLVIAALILLAFPIYGSVSGTAISDSRLVNGDSPKTITEEQANKMWLIATSCTYISDSRLVKGDFPIAITEEQANKIWFFADPDKMPLGARTILCLWVPCKKGSCPKDSFEYLLDPIEGKDVLKCVEFRLTGSFSTGKSVWGAWSYPDGGGVKALVGNTNFIADKKGKARIRAIIRWKNGLSSESNVIEVVVGEPDIKGKDYRGKRLNVAMIDLVTRGMPAGDAKLITEMLRNSLASSGAMNVVDASAIKNILAEHVYQEAGCIDSECAIRLGRLLKADYVVVGEVVKSGLEYSVKAGLVEVEMQSRWEKAGIVPSADRPIQAMSLIWREEKFRDTEGLDKAVAALARYFRERMP